MSKRVAIARAAVAGAAALGFAVQAQAQSGSYQPAPSGSYSAQSPNGYYYDPCKRDQAQRATVGALLGGAGGAVIGSNVAARNARPEGALLGGLLGAIAGGVTGSKTAACAPSYSSSLPPPPRADATYHYDRDAYADAAADQARRDAYRYDRRYEDSRPAAESRTPDPESCTLAESPIYMPDGRTQSRFVRVCRGPDGRYAVVD
jgi:hypothetical protein